MQGIRVAAFRPSFYDLVACSEVLFFGLPGLVGVLFAVMSASDMGIIKLTNDILCFSAMPNSQGLTFAMSMKF